MKKYREKQAGSEHSKQASTFAKHFFKIYKKKTVNRFIFYRFAFARKFKHKMYEENNKDHKAMLKDVISSRWEQLDETARTTTPEDVAEKLLQVLSAVPEYLHNIAGLMECFSESLSSNETICLEKEFNLSRLIQCFNIFSSNLYKCIWHRDIEKDDLQKHFSFGEIAIKYELLQERKVGNKILELRKMRNRLVYGEITEINKKELDSATQDLIDLYILAIAENAKLMDLDL